MLSSLASTGSGTGSDQLIDSGPGVQPDPLRVRAHLGAGPFLPYLCADSVTARRREPRIAASTITCSPPCLQNRSVVLQLLSSHPLHSAYLSNQSRPEAALTESSDGDPRLAGGTVRTRPHDTETTCHGERSMNYREAADRAAAVAAALAELGMCSGERVLIMLPDGPGFIEAFVGVMQRGAVPLPVNPALQAEDVRAIAAEACARLVMSSAERIHVLADLETGPFVLVGGPQGLWAARLRPS